MFTFNNSVATVSESGTYYVGDVSFIIEQKSHKLVNEKLELFKDTLFVNMYGTMSRRATVIKHKYIKTVPIISNIGITLLKNAHNKLKDDNSLRIELKLTKGDTIRISNTIFDGIQIQFVNKNKEIFAIIPLNFKRD